MNGQILVPLDGSVRAELILPHATALARATGRIITLFRVEPMIDPVFLPTLIGAFPVPGLERPDWPRSYLAEIAEELTAQGVSTRVDVAFGGDIAAAILERARAPHIDLIAMATHGRVGVERWIAGSVAELVLADAPRPLLLVRSQGAHGKPLAREEPTLRTILVALDGSPFAMQALHQARTLAQTSGATVVLLAVAPLLDDLGLAEGGIEPLWMLAERQVQETYLKESLDKVATELRLSGLRVRARVLAGDPAETIIRTCREEVADLLVMATHGRSSLRRLFLGSVTTGVLHHAEVPILLIRPQPQPRASQQDFYEEPGRVPARSSTSTLDGQ